VKAVDISGPTIARASQNSALNKLTAPIEFFSADVFEYLPQASKGNQKFDLIVLDPPSFAKSKKSLVRARRGYKEIHMHAFRLLNPGGVLATASCSHHIYEETFLDIINECARSAGRIIRLLEWRGAAPDHPVLPAMPETRYLKFGHRGQDWMI